MRKKVTINSVYKLSEDVVARDIQGELIIIPITSGIGDLDEAIFTFNETGRAIWEKMDGKKSLKVVADEIASEFEGPKEDIKKDVLGLANELLDKKMLVDVTQ